MRKIEFRGLVADEPYTWVYGYLMPDNRIYQVHEPTYGCCGKGVFSVIPESIGQYTGCRDKHNIKIYENDIVKDFEHGYCYTVIYKQGSFLLRDDDGKCIHIKENDLKYYEVIGNEFILKEDNKNEFRVETIYRILRCLL